MILFSDILTPITGMNIPFDIIAGKGPVILDPIRTLEQVRGGGRCCACATSSGATGACCFWDCQC